MTVHYGTTPERPDYTPCGYFKEYVITTFDWNKVTCVPCFDEDALSKARAGTCADCGAELNPPVRDRRDCPNCGSWFELRSNEYFENLEPNSNKAERE